MRMRSGLPLVDTSALAWEKPPEEHTVLRADSARLGLED